MNYREAEKKRKESLDRVDTVDEKGFTIKEIWIIPSEENAQNQWIERYLSGEPESNPDIHADYEVWAVDTEYLRSSGILFYDKIA